MEDLHSEFADLIDAQDWTGIGKYLADKINSGLQFVFDAINWDKVGPKITHFAVSYTHLPVISGGEAMVYGAKRRILQGTKARNPDGSVNFTEVMLI